jgi:plastocyanin
VGAYLLVGARGAGATASCTGTPDATIAAVGTTAWSPEEVTLSTTGEVVCWLNNSGNHHILTSDTGAFQPIDLPATGSTHNVPFNTPGTYPFHCSIHPVMIGTIFVPSTAVNTTTSPVSGSNSANPTITGTAPPNTTVNIYEGTACGTLIDTTTSDGSGDWSYTVSDPDSIPKGSTVQFSARSASPSNGVVSDCSASSASYTAGTTPDLNFTGGPEDGAVIVDSTPTFMFGPSENGITFTCLIDSGTFSACSGSGTDTPASALPAGTHFILVRATDGTNVTVVKRSFTLDLSDPVIKGRARTKSRRPKFTLTGDTSLANVRCKFDGRSFVDAVFVGSGTWTCQSGRLRPGKHTIFAQAIDSTTGDDPGPIKLRHFTILR